MIGGSPANPHAPSPRRRSAFDHISPRGEVLAKLRSKGQDPPKDGGHVCHKKRIFLSAVTYAGQKPLEKVRQMEKSPQIAS